MSTMFESARVSVSAPVSGLPQPCTMENARRLREQRKANARARQKRRADRISKPKGSLKVDPRVLKAAYKAKRPGEKVRIVSETEVWLVYRD